MDLLTSLSKFASGSAISDTVTPAVSSMTTQNASLDGIKSIPGISSAADTITSMASAVTEKWQAMLSQLPVALPAMKAIHVLEKKMEMVNGGVSSSAGSATFQAYFGAVDGIKAKLAEIQASVSASFDSLATAATSVPGVSGSGLAALQSLAGQIPAATIPDPNDPTKTITNPAYTSFMSSSAVGTLSGAAGSLASNVSTGSAAVQTQFAAADTAYKSAMSQLSGMAFASFCAQPQPEPVQAVINKVVDPSVIPKQDSLDKFNRSGSAWMGSQMSAVKGDAPAIARKDPDALPPVEVSRTTYVPTKATEAQLDAIDAQIEAQKQTTNAASRAADAAAPKFRAWKESVNYDAAKNNAANDPDTYASLRAQALQNADYKEMQAQLNAFNEANVKYTKLREIRQYMRTTGPWPGNPDGPW